MMMILTGILYLAIVSTSIPLKPKAESPTTITTFFLGYKAYAAIANPNPTPIVPKVPASNLYLGAWFIKIVLPMSIVLDPSDTRIYSSP
jgi:hypothetical protein